jgi:ribosomal protein L19
MNYFAENFLVPKSYNLKKEYPFYIGDILGLSFKNKGYSYFFEGLCIAVRKKKVLHPESTLILRNILGTVGIEVSFSYYYNRIFFMRVNNFKRKKLSYTRSKLYYVRHKLNKASRVS